MNRYSNTMLAICVMFALLIAPETRGDLATLTFNTNTMFADDSSNTIQIAGNTLTPQTYDRMVFNSALVADGDLKIELVGPTCSSLNAYEPVLGDVFEVLSITSATSGSFDLSLPALSPGLVWDSSALLDPNAAVPGSLRIAAVPEVSGLQMCGLFGALVLVRRLVRYVARALRDRE